MVTDLLEQDLDGFGGTASRGEHGVEKEHVALCNVLGQLHLRGVSLRRSQSKDEHSTAWEEQLPRRAMNGVRKRGERREEEDLNQDLSDAHSLAHGPQASLHALTGAHNGDSTNL